MSIVLNSNLVDSFAMSSLLFHPNPSHQQHKPLFNRNFTPRYLYRLVVHQTTGPTTTSNVVPPTSTQPQTDIFHLPTQEAATLLFNHLCGKENGLNLTSWTSSLVFTLQYALYRYQKDGNDLNRVQLIILDTTLFPKGTFMQDMEIMRSLAQGDERLQTFVKFRESKYYFGEYISRGGLQDRCVCTSMQKMIDLGLFQLQPLLADRTKWQQLPKEVLAFREQFTCGKPLPTPDAHVEIAVDIARQCFGAQWAVSVAIMLLALLPREVNDMAISEGFKSRFSGKPGT